MIELILIAAGTALATGFGAIPVWFLGSAAKRLEPALIGLAAGVMSVAAVVGLLEPALDDGSIAVVAIGALAGAIFLLLARRLLMLPHKGGPTTESGRMSLLVFAVLFVHSLPEGLALGTAYASTVEGLAVFIVIAIAVQNVPEGTSIAIPMNAAGYSRRRQFWAAVTTSAPQPIGAVIAYLAVDRVEALLPISFAFAAAAMLALVAVELLPDSLRLDPPRALTGFLLGGAAMLGLSLALGV